MMSRSNFVEIEIGNFVSKWNLWCLIEMKIPGNAVILKICKNDIVKVKKYDGKSIENYQQQQK